MGAGQREDRCGTIGKPRDPCGGLSSILTAMVGTWAHTGAKVAQTWIHTHIHTHTHTITSVCFPCLSYHTSVLQKVTIIGYWTKCTRNLSVLFFTTAGASAAISIDILIKIPKKKKKKRGEPISLEAVNIIHLLSLSPWVYVFAIFCVAKRDTAIPLLGCRLKRGGGLKENVSAVVWIAALLSQSSWQTKYGYLVLGSPQTFS